MHRSLHFSHRLRLGLLVLLVLLGTLGGSLGLARHPSKAVGISHLSTPGSVSFAAPVPYPTGAVPNALATGDLTGKGRTDVVTANYGDGTSGSVSVLLGRGDGTFAPAVSYPVDNGPWDVAIADLNGDGKLDIVTANVTAGDLSILFGNGDGTFKPAVNISIPGQHPQGVAAADLNGDGKMDLIVADGYPSGAGPSGASVLLGNGDGTFQSPVFYATGSTYQATSQILVGHFTGHQALDVAVVADGCGYGGGQISILPGNGDGTFGKEIVTPESCIIRATAADLNGDGKLDLALAVGNGTGDPGTTFAVVLLGNGDGTFSQTAQQPTAPATNAEGIAVADLNGDGKPDVILGDIGADGSVPGQISVFLGNGDGTLGPVDNIAGDPNRGPWALTTADLNGDGRPDVIVAEREWQPAEITVRLNTTISQMVPVGGAITSNENPGSGNASEVHVCSCQGSAGQPINTATGNFWHSFTDISIPGRGFPLVFSRTYNSRSAATNGPLGYGWSFSYGMSLTTTATGATITQENGSQVTFTVSGSSYTPTAPRELATLVKNADGTYTFTRRSREIFSFTASGQLTQEKDLNGYITTLSYTNGQLTGVTDPAGRNLVIGWTGANITSVTDPTGRQVVFGYNDGAGNLTDVTDVGGGNEHFTYDPSSHLLLTMRDPRGNTVTNHYDSSGRVDWQKDELGRQTNLAYTTSGSISTTTITDPAGNVRFEQYEYGLLVAVTKGYGTPQAATWSYLYDPSTIGTTSVTDPNGHTTTATYDARGNVLTTKDALGHKTVNTYDSLDDLLTTKDPLKVTTTMTYDAAGNIQTRSRPLVGTSQVQLTMYKYTDPTHPGDVTQIIDPDSKTWVQGYDTYGDLTTSVDPLGDMSTSTYNTIGWLQTQVSPKGNVTGCNCAFQYTTTFGHDPFGRVTTIKDPLGHVTTRHYDPDGNLNTISDADKKTTKYTYDFANELSSVTRADGTVVTTTYNNDGTIYQQIDGRGKATAYGYDPLARVTSVTDPLNRTTAYTYDGVGNRLTIKDPQSQTTTFGYDAANELTSITYNDGKSPNVSSITYDADGQRRAMKDGTGTSWWLWDSLHRLTKSVNGAGSSVSYGYDLAGNMTSLTYPGGSQVTRSYDDAGRLHTVTDWLGNTTTFGYDPNSNLTTETLPASTGIVDTFTFDNANRLMSISDTKGGTPFATFSYSRDNNNQLTSEKKSGVPGGVSNTYRYNSLNQLATVNGKTYSYDPADNLTGFPSGATLAYDDANELCWTLPSASSNGCATPPTGATTYSYDPRGNRTSVTNPSATPIILTYDQANRLTGYGASGTTPYTYAYNGDGLRVSKTSPSGTKTNFTWDAAEGLSLLLKEGTRSYVYGPGGLPLEQINGTSVLWHHHDQLGSTRVLTDSSGAVVATYTYDAYGKTIGRTGTAGTNLQYGGEYLDSESGMYYMHARYYDPNTGQFISRDPLTAVTRSPYGYVAGNPLNRADPLGLCIWIGCNVQDFLNSNGYCTVMQDNCQSLASQTPVISDAGSALYHWQSPDSGMVFKQTCFGVSRFQLCDTVTADGSLYVSPGASANPIPFPVSFSQSQADSVHLQGGGCTTNGNIDDFVGGWSVNGGVYAGQGGELQGSTVNGKPAFAGQVGYGGIGPSGSISYAFGPGASWDSVLQWPFH